MKKTINVVFVLALVAGSVAYGDLKYEGGVDPVLRFFRLDGGAGSHSSDGDILTITDGDINDEYRFAIGTDALASVGWTCVIRAKNDDADLFTTKVRLIEIADGTYREQLLMGNDANPNVVQLRRKSSAVPVTVDTTQWHTYRITRQGTQVALYLDENPTPVDSGSSTSTTDDRYVFFGSDSADNEGTIQIDYIRIYASGAYAPGEEPAALNPLLDPGLDQFYGAAPDQVPTGWEKWGITFAGSYLEEHNEYWTHSEPRASLRLYEPNSNTFDCGIRQQVLVGAGAQLTFSAWFQRYFQPGAETDSFYQVGIDPQGDTDPEGTVWSDPVQGDGTWQQASVQATAEGNFVTVYIRGFLPQDAPPPFGNERDIFLDDAALVVESSIPCENDLDNDGVCDEQETFDPLNNPTLWTAYLDDSDLDGLSDGTEDTNRNGVRDAGETNPVGRDSDADGWYDGVEVLIGSDPLSAADPGAVADADNDKLPDSVDPDNTKADADGDGFRDWYEAALLGTDAASDDTIVPSLGDVNADTFQTNVDALVIQSLFVGNIDLSNPVFKGEGFSNSDPSGDRQASNIDALMIQSFFIGNLAMLPLF